MTVEKGQYWHHIKTGMLAHVLGVAVHCEEAAYRYDVGKYGEGRYIQVINVEDGCTMWIYRAGEQLYHSHHFEDDLVIYSKGGELWARRLDEFTDGRFFKNSELK